jgi:ribosomal protein S18 acetylase RimI-like enzyme
MDAESFRIRRATTADAADILACLHEAFTPYRERYSAGGFRDTVLDHETIRHRLSSMSVLVAISADGRIVGTVGTSLADDKTGHIRGMAVVPSSQGRGVAGRLLDAAERQLSAGGCRRVTLDTTAVLEPARRFYERHGYRASGRVADFFGMPLFEYVKDLTP